ncbi:hypothetical protein LP416_10325 [Polaromonas sp. P2-4]|nr:hypothetical protein LP416_10325 [Polaromonas sp. P2-4]
MVPGTALVRGLIKRSAWLAALVMSCCTSAWSAWPEKPITIIVPYAAGGLTDAVTRALTDAMGRELGQPVVGDNRAGAGGKSGMEQTTQACAQRRLHDWTCRYRRRWSHCR